MILIRITNTFSIIDEWKHHSMVDIEAKCLLYSLGPGTWIYDDNICFKHLDASVIIKKVIIKINIYIYIYIYLCIFIISYKAPLQYIVLCPMFRPLFFILLYNIYIAHYSQINML